MGKKVKGSGEEGAEKWGRRCREMGEKVQGDGGRRRREMGKKVQGNGEEGAGRWEEDAGRWGRRCREEGKKMQGDGGRRCREIRKKVKGNGEEVTRRSGRRCREMGGVQGRYREEQGRHREEKEGAGCILQPFVLVWRKRQIFEFLDNCWVKHTCPSGVFGINSFQIFLEHVCFIFQHTVSFPSNN